MKNTLNPEPDGPQDHPHYIFKDLNRIEKLTINLVYYKTWRKLVKSKDLTPSKQEYFKLYFKEIHTRYYKRVVRGPSFVKASRLTLNFLFSRANENLRAILLSLKPYNLTTFVHAIRSQVELNALIQKFIQDEDYHKKNLNLNEDRAKQKELDTVININTLVHKLGESLLPYTKTYNDLSLLLHPNPTAIRFYAQADGEPTNDKSGIFRPQIKYYFNETIAPTEQHKSWFDGYLWFFLSSIEHFIILTDSLKNDFFLDEQEEKMFTQFAYASFVEAHKSEILAAINQAVAEGSDPTERVKEVFERTTTQKGQ
jgi:hypothetical protein